MELDSHASLKGAAGPAFGWPKDRIREEIGAFDCGLRGALSDGHRSRKSCRNPPSARFGLTPWLSAILVPCLVCTALAFSFPPLTGRVVDQANVMSVQSRNDLEAKLQDLENKSGIQLVVATVKSLEGSDIESYANQLFRNWKLGEAKKNNGVLLLTHVRTDRMRARPRSSSDFAYIPILWASVLALLVPWPLIDFTQWSVQRIFLLQLLVFILAGFIFSWVP